MLFGREDDIQAGNAAIKALGVAFADAQLALEAVAGQAGFVSGPHADLFRRAKNAYDELMAIQWRIKLSGYTDANAAEYRQRAEQARDAYVPLLNSVTNTYRASAVARGVKLSTPPTPEEEIFIRRIAERDADLLSRVPGPTQSFTIQTTQAATDAIKANPEAITAQRPGTVGVSASKVDWATFVKGVFGLASTGFEEIQRQRLAVAGMKAAMRNQKVYVSPGAPGTGTTPTGQAKSEFPWGWVLLGGAVLLVGAGAFAYSRRKGSSAAATQAMPMDAPKL
jgi:hypothetical protein